MRIPLVLVTGTLVNLAFIGITPPGQAGSPLDKIYDAERRDDELRDALDRQIASFERLMRDVP
jgi:hypothetical protein